MIVSPPVTTEHEAEQIYQRAVARLQNELGWAPTRAHAAMAEFAAAHGVFLHDVARAVLAARSVKRGLAHALRRAAFDRRPLAMR